MKPLPTTCPKCDGAFIAGYCIDFAGHGAAVVPTWCEGMPEGSWFGGSIVVPPERKRMPLTTLRCSECGYVESYARKKFETKPASSEAVKK